MATIKVLEKNICGIKKPKVTTIIETDINDYEIEIIADDQKIDDYECISLEDNDTFLIQFDISKNIKVVTINMLEGKKKYNICKIKNNLVKRVMNKITGVIKNFFRKIKLFFRVLRKGIVFMWREYHFLVPPRLIKKYIKDFKRSMKSDVRYYNPFVVSEYNKWLVKNQTITEYKKMKYEPLISILIPVYNIGRKYLSECLDSVLNQNYKNFEVCLVDDASTNSETIETLKEYEKKDERIKVKFRKKNGHICNATNDALKMAKGEYIALLDNDDLLTEDALVENVIVLNKDKKIDFIYSDEDKMNKHGQLCNPHFKPDYSPDTLLSLNYICHFAVIRRKLVNEVGGFELGTEGSQDHDLFLKITEKTNKIYHISKILYHWRMVEGSTSVTIDNKSYATDKGKIAIENALKRRNIKGTVEKDTVSTYYRVTYEYDKEPLISIIIPTRDYKDITKKCIDSIYDKTKYKNFEIIVANNDSKEKETLDFFKEYQKKYNNFKVVDCIMNFNYSRINNTAIKSAKGDYIVLLNNDTEILTPEWLNIMVGYAMQKHVGTVGVKLLYPDMTVQHGGVILGLGGVASHAYIGASREDLGMYGRLRVPYDYAANTAACLMISKKKFNEVKGLEEDLQVAYNDIDFNIKLLSKGYYNVFLPQVELMHYESKSRGLDTTSEKYKRFIKEANHMLETWPEIINNDPFYNKNFSKKQCFKLDK